MHFISSYIRSRTIPSHMKKLSALWNVVASVSILMMSPGRPASSDRDALHARASVRPIQQPAAVSIRSGGYCQSGQIKFRCFISFNRELVRRPVPSSSSSGIPLNSPFLSGLASSVRTAKEPVNKIKAAVGRGPGTRYFQRCAPDRPARLGRKRNPHNNFNLPVRNFIC